MRVPTFFPQHALESMRASDFDIPSAVGELIDNAIQAKAKHINLVIETKTCTPTHSKKFRDLIDKIICADDGIGMDGKEGGVLHNCLCLGYSSRYNDRSGIGRFGVGMTFAGIRFATKIEVYSKDRALGQDWYYVKCDLKDKEDVERIAEPVKRPPSAEYEKLVQGRHGTIVIWSNFDKDEEGDMHVSTYDDVMAHNSKRRVGPYRKMQPEESLGPFGLLNHWIGRTFRKFIWGGVEITLNGKTVYAFDPLYLNNKSNVQFSGDTPATRYYEGDIEYHGENIHLEFTILPKMYRKESGKGGLDFPGRYIYDNEGISIMRANREVFYDHIPHWQGETGEKIGKDDKDRWWGCEISFEPVLDEYFSMKNIKRGATPVKDLKETLYEKLSPAIKKARLDVGDYWKEEKYKKDIENKDNPHKEAEDIAKRTNIVGKINAGNTLVSEAAQEMRKEIEDGMSEDERQNSEASFRDKPFTIREDHWKGDSFIETGYVDGKAVLKYNRNHPYMEELLKLRERLGGNRDAVTVNNLLDILLMALTYARGTMADDEESTVEDIWDKFLGEWGRSLKSYTQTYKREHPEYN